MKDINNTIIWDGPGSLVPPNCELVELAPIPIPPNLPELADQYGQLTIEMLAKRIAGGSNTLAFDFMHLFATDMFVKGIAKGPGCTTNAYLMLDGGLHKLYIGAQRTTAFSSDWQVFGDPGPLVFPGRLHQFSVLTMSSSSTSDILRTLGVKAYYRPRKRLL